MPSIHATDDDDLDDVDELYQEIFKLQDEVAWLRHELDVAQGGQGTHSAGWCRMDRILSGDVTTRQVA